LLAFDAVFIVECNTFGSGIGAFFHQGIGSIAFFSRPLVLRHSKLVAYEREFISLV
jgi:hypothetical protein